MTEQLNQFINLIVGIATLMALIGGGYFVVKKWVITTSKSVETKNGESVGSYTEQTHKDVQEMMLEQRGMKEELNIVAVNVMKNRDTAIEALTLAKQANERLDAYFVGLHSREDK